MGENSNLSMRDDSVDIGDSVLDNSQFRTQSNAQHNQDVSQLMHTQESQQERQQKLKIRQEYRKLIQETQENKEELVKPDNDELTTKIAKAHELFKNVHETREGVLDSRFMSLAVTLGTQKTSMLQTDLIAFEADSFVQKLISFMDGTTESRNVRISPDGWKHLGKNVSQCFKSMVPAFHPLLGSFDVAVKERKQTGPRPAKDDGSAKAQNPQKLTNYNAEQKEATPAEIERVYKIINALYAHDPSPIDYFELVLNPQHYGHTIENCFHLAFLIKDGLVKLFLNDVGLPVVEPVQERDETANGAGDVRNDAPQDNTQVMVSLSMDEWTELVDAYQLTGKEPYITPSSDVF